MNQNNQESYWKTIIGIQKHAGKVFKKQVQLRQGHIFSFTQNLLYILKSRTFTSFLSQHYTVVRSQPISKHQLIHILVMKSFWIGNNQISQPTAKVIIEKSRGGRFYGTGIEIWAGFGLVWQFLRPFFHVFMGKFFLKDIVDGENIFGIE